MSGWKFEIVFNYILFEPIEKLVINAKFLFYLLDFNYFLSGRSLIRFCD